MKCWNLIKWCGEKAVPNKERWMEGWRWMFVDNPAGALIIWLARYDGKLVRQYPLVMMNMKIGEEIIMSAQIADTMTHTTLTKLPIEETGEEIIRSKKDIEERLGIPCTLFAYPNGEFNTKIIELLKENGLKSAVTIIPGMLTNRENPFRLNLITAGFDFYTFKAYLSGLYLDLMTALWWVKGSTMKG